MIGKSLAHYEITALLGKGGMGEVYRARDLKLDRDVALKVLPTELSGDPERAAGPSFPCATRRMAGVEPGTKRGSSYSSATGARAS